MIQGFTVHRRNYGHWDILTDRDGRAFRIRGGPGHWQIFDERIDGRIEKLPRFGSQCAAMAFICSALMHENIVVEGVEQNTIESWNIPAEYERS